MAAPDEFQHYQRGLDGPYEDGFPITPDDETDLPKRTLAIWVGGTGSLSVVMASGATVTMAAVPAGTLLKMRVDRVLETTTATVLVGLA